MGCELRKLAAKAVVTLSSPGENLVLIMGRVLALVVATIWDEYVKQKPTSVRDVVVLSSCVFHWTVKAEVKAKMPKSCRLNVRLTHKLRVSRDQFITYGSA